jgi:hypothetical protein
MRRVCSLSPLKEDSRPRSRGPCLSGNSQLLRPEVVVLGDRRQHMFRVHGHAIYPGPPPLPLERDAQRLKIAWIPSAIRCG